MTEEYELDSLSLLAHKVASNVFDLSSMQSNVSIRDQMVRAQQLVIDLRQAHKVPGSVLIVGMGVAGMTAALTAIQEGFKQVYAVDTKDEPFSLFRGVTSRFVGPYMYEWPSPFCATQSYPGSHTPWKQHGSPVLAWSAEKPICADDLRKKLLRCVRKWHRDQPGGPASSPHRFLVQVDEAGIKEFVKNFAEVERVRALQDANGESRADPVEYSNFGALVRSWPSNKASHNPITPDYVIVAAGMGRERLAVAGVATEPTRQFWSNDDLKDDLVEKRVVVLGGGDGAIQDALRALTIFDHPLEFIQKLEQNLRVKAALQKELPSLLSADRQLRQHSSWSRHDAGFAMADEACRKAADRLAKKSEVVKAVRDCLRTGKGCVIQLVKSSSLDKAYLLNRFIAHLLAKCAGLPGRGRMTYELRFDSEVKQGKKEGASTRLTLELENPKTQASCGSVDDVDKLVVRFGIDPVSIPGPQLVQLDDKYPRYRTTLTRVELPFVTM